MKRCGVCNESLDASGAAILSAETNAKITRNSKRQTEGCLLRAGARKLRAACCKKCCKARVSASPCSRKLFPLAPSCVPVLHTNERRWFGMLRGLGPGFSSHCGLSAQVNRVHFLQCAHRGDSSRRRGRAPAAPTWVSERKPAVTRGRYKYFIPGETRSQINSTRGHINAGVVKMFDSPKGDC